MAFGVRRVLLASGVWRNGSTAGAHLSTSALLSTLKIEQVVVVGGGLMGTGIAQVAAQTGHQVTLTDLSPDILSSSSTRIMESVKRVAKKQFQDSPEAGNKFLAETMHRIKTTTDPASALATADLVIESVVEKLDVKQKIFTQFNGMVPDKTIFASNTSSLPIGQIFSVIPDRLDRCGGLHFFNPVPMMKLLEVIRIPQTSDDTLAAMTTWGKAMKKVTVAAKDTPGFIVNRLLVPSLMEAVRMVERGDATPEDVDVAMKLGAGHPMGPFELADYVGLDTTKFIIDGWHQAHPDETLFKPSPLLDRLVAEGKLGRKSGQGFYNYRS